MRTRLRQVGVLAVAAALVAGCAAPLEISRRARDVVPSLTEDGLYRVEASQVGAVYLRPDAIFAVFDAVMFDPCTLAYAYPPRAKTILRRQLGNYRLDRETSERAIRTLREAFELELARSESFRLAVAPGPNVLRVSCHIVDLVWELPDAVGGATAWVRQSGVMTLVVNLRDSESGVILARIADRMAIRPEGTGLAGGFENRPVNNWAGVRYVSKRWARILRVALDSLRSDPASDLS